MSITPQNHKLGMLKLPEPYTLEIAKLMLQYSHHTFPQPFYMFFKSISSMYERFTRAKTENKLYRQNFLQHIFKNLLNIKELKYGARSQLKLGN